MPTIHTFAHEAMKTTYTLRMCDSNVNEAAGVAKECFEYLDYIETKLNRYLEGSDIWQINHLQAGESLFVSEPCYECLKLALQAYQLTGGLFDITIGKQIEHVKKGASGDFPDVAGQLAIDPDRPAVHCQESGRELDLGGIGKGYALDQMKRLLQDWGVQAALLSSGASTQLSYGEHTWPIELCGDCSSIVFKLKNMALSASGIGIQGSHIVSPFSDTVKYLHKRVWVAHASAALADALSTALMLAEDSDLDSLDLQGSTVYVETQNGELRQYFN